MAFKCGFFNSVNGDRKYNADEMMNPIKGIVSDGVIANDKFSDGLQVQAYQGLKIFVKKGFGKFKNKWCENEDDNFILTVPKPHVTNTRIDSVVIRIDLSDEVRNGTIEYKQGTTIAPELERTNEVMEYRLANITVAPNASEITQANIEDTRPTAECGFVTNLLQDSDISATYAQWQAQFREWLAGNDAWAENKKTEHENFIESEQAEYNEWTKEKQQEYNSWTDEKKAEFDSWYSNIKDTLSKTNLITSYFSIYTTENENENEIPINISALNSALDCMQVHINGMLLVPEVDYKVNDFETITLTKPVDIGTTITFSVLKTIDGSESESVVKSVQDINDTIDDLKKTDNLLQRKIVGLETGTDVSYNLEFLPNSLLKSSRILVEAQNKMYGMSFSQLKQESGKIAVVPISTSLNKEIGEMWIENEVTNISNGIFNFSEIGKINTTKQGQVVCLFNFLYVLNENGKLFKIDLENNSCVALYSDLTFNFIQVTDTLIVFAGSNSTNVKAIQYRTGEEYSLKNGDTDNFLSSVDKVFNFGNQLNKFSCFTVHDTKNKIIQSFQFIIDADNELSIYYNSDQAKNYSEQANFKDYTVAIMYSDLLDDDGNTNIMEIAGILTNEDVNSELAIDNLYNLFACTNTDLTYKYFIQNSKTKYLVAYNLDDFAEKEFYSDDVVTSEVISMIIGKYKFYTLQKTTSGVAVIRYDFVNSEFVPTKLMSLNSNCTDLIIDLDQQDKVDMGQLLTPEFIFCRNNSNFVAEKTNFEYESKLKIKFPDGIKTIGAN